jgi:hypothetical protein
MKPEALEKKDKSKKDLVKEVSSKVKREKMAKSVVFLGDKLKSPESIGESLSRMQSGRDQNAVLEILLVEAPESLELVKKSWKESAISNQKSEFEKKEQVKRAKVEAAKVRREMLVEIKKALKH